jgi:microcin C transport system substrate-binding protein
VEILTSNGALPLISRRVCLLALSSTVLTPGLRPALAQGGETPLRRHALSLFGTVKYPADFKHFDYVNPAAPKGGTVRLIAVGTFDNFNVAVAAVKGSIAAGITMIYDQLMADSLDEVSTAYGEIAESVTYPADYASVTYRLRPEAKWQDGKPITVDDVIFSFQTFKKYDPTQAAYYGHVKEVKQTGPHDVTFTFDMPGNRELPQIVGQIYVLPKHWWEGTDAQGRKRKIGETTLEPPLGGGAYRIKTFVPGRSLVYERVKDYWGAGLPVNVGQSNFDEIRFEYFRDPTVALEAFKAGQVDWRTENSAKNWATAYDFPAIHEKRVVKEEFPVRNSGIMQAFAFNIRRDKFKDARIRHALNYTLDFEAMNKTLFYGTYYRINSYFYGTELAWDYKPDPKAPSTAPPASASGLPEGDELKILETVRGKVPPEVFTQAYKNPVGGSAENVRNNLRQAIRLFREAGYEIRNQKMVNAKTGEPFTMEFLVQSDPSYTRLALFLKPALERLGIAMTVRPVDDSQYENRLRSWDYDVIIASWPESLSPGNEQRFFWGSQAADQAGSRNYIGIKNPAVDALIDRIIFARDRATLVHATRALDRVLLWNWYVIPQFSYPKVRTARWDRFAHPDTMPTYGASAFPTIWWWDAVRAAKLGNSQ